MSGRGAEHVAAFLARLGESERLVHTVLSDAQLSASLDLRGPTARRVRLDFSARPGRIHDDDGRSGSDVTIAIDGDVMHEVLLGRRRAGEAFGSRELLLRGSPGYLARLVPLFAIAPPLYREHLLREDVDMQSKNGEVATLALARPGLLHRGAMAVLRGLAWTFGYCAGFVRYRLFRRMSLFEVLNAMSRGIAAATPAKLLPTRTEDE